MLVLKEGVQGINISDLNSMYRANLKEGREPVRLSDAFDWNKSPEGYQFWSFVNGITKIVPEIDTAKEEISVLPEPFRTTVSKELNMVNRNKSKSLRWSFKWNESPQGAAFWKLVSEMIRFYTEGASKEPEAYGEHTSNGEPAARGIRVIKKAQLNPQMNN